MPTRRLPPIRTAAALAVLLALAGCGGGSSASSSQPATQTTGGRESTPATTARTPRPAWLTYHRNLARTGLDPSSPPLGNVRRAWTRRVDAQVYAEPLVSGGRVIVATERNSVYALSTRTGRVLWHARLGQPVDGSTLPCGNIDPSGITSTPVATTTTVYAVVFLAPARHQLVALDIATGRTRWRRAVDPPGGDPRVHQQRAALALSRGRVYVSYGGLNGDCGDYRGTVVSIPAGGRGALRSFRVPTERRGAIWAPSGPAVDAAGNLFVATGNSASSGSFDFGNSVIRLTPGLRRTSFWAPANWAALNGGDVDLGSTGPLLLPGGRVFVIGKEGKGYLLNAARLGGIGGQLDTADVCDGAFGGSAYAAGLIYAPCTDRLVALRPGARTLSVAWRGPGFRAGPPIVAGGAVWTVDLDGGTLYALGTRSGQVRARVPIGDPAQFTTPTAAAGRIYVGGGAQVVALAGV